MITPLNRAQSKEGTSTRLQHVAHEGLWMLTTWGVNHIDDHGWKGGSKGFSDDGTRGRPGENFDLTWCIHNYILGLRISFLLAEANHLQRSATYIFLFKWIRACQASGMVRHGHAQVHRIAMPADLTEQAKIAHLIEARGKQVHGSEDPPIWSQVVLLHDILIVDLAHSVEEAAQHG